MTKKKALIVLPLTLVGIIIGILFFRSFVLNETKYMDAVCESQLNNYAAENVSGIKDELLNALNDIRLVSADFEEQTINQSAATAKTLRVLSDNTDFSRLFLCDTEGKSINSSGTEFDYSSRDFFEKALHGESSILFDKGGDGLDHILISAPVISGGKVTGTVHGELDLYPLYKKMNTNSFDGLGYATLVDSKGEYVIVSDSEYVLNTMSQNIFDWIKKTKISDDSSYDTMKASMESGLSGVIRYKVKDEGRILCYIPIGVNNWYLLQQVSDEYVSTLVSGTKRNVIVLVAEVTLWIILLVICLMLYARKQRSVQEAAVKRFLALADNIPGGVAELEIGKDYVIRYANDGFYSLTGYSKEEFENQTDNGRSLIVSPKGIDSGLFDTAKAQVDSGDSVSLEYRIRRKDGELRWLNTAGSVISRTQDSAVVQAIVADITMQKEQTAMVADRARHDKMTQLFDKVSTVELINQVLSSPSEDKSNVVIVFDIDNFKHINDSYGHQTGDIAIIYVAKKLKEHFRNTDIIGRIGGDEFVVCMCGVPDESFVRSKIEHLQEKIRSITIAGTEGLISCSAGGVMIYPSVKTDYDHAFQLADSNLYEIKKGYKGMMKISDIYLSTTGEGRG